MGKKIHDVVVLGAGVVGCALAKRFAQSGFSTALIDRAYDVGEGGASKSNSAIIHTGFDCTPGSLEAKLVSKASLAWPAMAKSLGIPFETPGALMLARNAREFQYCEKYHALARENGVNDCKLLSARECREMEPLAWEGREVVGGLHIPRESITDPFATCQAYAKLALESGKCDLYLGREIERIERADDALLHCFSKEGERITGRAVINSTGLGAQALHQASFPQSPFTFTLNPRRGQFLVYEKPARALLNKILLPIPNASSGKGILITPTIFGNVLCGPTAEDLPMQECKTATQTTAAGLRQVQSAVLDMLPQLGRFSPIAQYAGARSNCKEGQYLFDFNPQSNVVTLAGIRSTGLSASFAIADYVFEKMRALNMLPALQRTAPREQVSPTYPAWYVRRTTESVCGDRSELICYCEQVTKEDIAQALQQTSCPGTTDALKRRTRVTTGKCQGFHCLVPLCRQISSERKIKVSMVRKNAPGTEWFPHYRDTLPFPPPKELLPKRVFPLFSREEETNHFQCIVIGSGPAGCGVVSGLIKSAIMDKILLLEQSSRLGGVPARYINSTSKASFATGRGLVTGEEFAKQYMRDVLGSNKVYVRTQTQVVRIENEASQPLCVVTHTGHRLLADSVVLATGAREANAVERNLLVTGHRASRVLFTNHLLESGGAAAAAELGKVASLGAGLLPRSILLPSSTHFIAQEADEHARLAQWYFGGNATTTGNNNGEEHCITSASPHLALDGTLYDTIVLGGCLQPNLQVLDNVNGRSRIYMAGNCAHRNWPGMACYLHGKHVTAPSVLLGEYMAY